MKRKVFWILVAFFFVVTESAAADSPIQYTRHIYSRTELTGLDKTQLVNLAYSLQQRVLLDEAGSTTTEATASAPLQSATPSPEASRHRSITPFIVGLAIAAVASVSERRNAQMSSPLFVLSSTGRSRRISSIQPLQGFRLSTDPANTSYCDTASYLSAAFSLMSGGLFASEKYANSQAAPTPPPSQDDVNVGKSQKKTDTAIAALLGLTTAVRSCGTSGAATVQANAAAGPAIRNNSRLSSPAGTTITVAPSGRQGFCEALGFAASTWSSNGNTWLNTSEPGRNNTYIILRGLLEAGVPATKCNDLTPVVSTGP